MSNKFNLKDVQSAYYGLLTEAKIDDALDKVSLSSESKRLVKEFNNSLTNKSKYVEFIIKNIAGEKYVDDVLTSDLAQTIEYFDKYSQAFPGVNISNLKIKELVELVQDHKDRKELESSSSDVEKVFEDDEMLIVSPKTYKGSVKYGRGARWCISMKNDESYWIHHTSKGEKFYFLLSKVLPSTNMDYKVAAQVDINGKVMEYWNSGDVPMRKVGSYDVSKYTQYFKPMDKTEFAKIKLLNAGFKFNEKTGRYDTINLTNQMTIESIIGEDGKFIVPIGEVDNFVMVGQRLESLENGPSEVNYRFSISDCPNLENLKFFPKRVFNCSLLQLKISSLEGITDRIDNNLEIMDNYSLKFTNLEHISTHIDGNLQINNCKGLSSLKGLENVKYIGGMLTIYNCHRLTSIDYLPEVIEGAIVLDNCSYLTSFADITCEVNSISVLRCNNFVTLKGLPKHLKGDLIIKDCNKLKSLEGIPEIIDGDLIIMDCNLLTNIPEQLANVKIGGNVEYV